MISKKKRIIVLLTTVTILGTLLVYVWLNYNENTFLIVLLGIIGVGILLERYDHIFTKKKKGSPDCNDGEKLD